MINNRNEEVKLRLLEQFKVLGVFCVSNKLYSNPHAENTEAYKALSGISELRRHCQRLVTDAQLRTISDHLQVNVERQLGALRQWAQVVSDEQSVVRSANVCRVLKDAAAYLDQVQFL